MKIKKWKTALCLLGILAIFPAFADSPASVEYVNQQIAAFKTEILQLLNAGA